MRVLVIDPDLLSFIFPGYIAAIFEHSAASARAAPFAQGSIKAGFRISLMTPESGTSHIIATSAGRLLRITNKTCPGNRDGFHPPPE